MSTFKSFSELKRSNETFVRDRREALLHDQISSAWRWFERNINYKDDYVPPMHRLYRKSGVVKTLRRTCKRS
jgi:hypothetical protein